MCALLLLEGFYTSGSGVVTRDMHRSGQGMAEAGVDPRVAIGATNFKKNMSSPSFLLSPRLTPKTFFVPLSSRQVKW